MDLYLIFNDLRKAFDSINGIALSEILKKLGFPEKFVRMLRQLHDNMKVRANVGGTLSDPISLENGVKQGDIPAPTLFAMSPLYCSKINDTQQISLPNPTFHEFLFRLTLRHSCRCNSFSTSADLLSGRDFRQSLSNIRTFQHPIFIGLHLHLNLLTVAR
ncbi:uncharacterized protein LOC115230065 [Octopus sinensis]|uniref:Uncharacterized protein LOC115230065 n=1 Tax=Octopus sinensis TaxID=2607531 RepID=A0A6P7TV07_9MOLL|nr:uncharacterized protein LOC115230065 [Octopus sinensis]